MRFEHRPNDSKRQVLKLLIPKVVIKNMRFIAILMLGCLSTNAKAQSTDFLPVNYNLRLRLQMAIEAQTDSSHHQGFYPLNPFTYRNVRPAFTKKYRLSAPFADSTWVGRKLFNEMLIDLHTPDFDFQLHPVLNVQLGNDSRTADETPYINTRGFFVQGRIGENVAFYSDFYENQARFPMYINEWIGQNNYGGLAVLPGQGAFKGVRNQRNARDFAYASGAVSLQASRFFNFQLGYGKQFIGDGYRSFLLSDNAFSYPYFRIQSNFWRIQYTNLYTQLRDVRFKNADESFRRKYMVAHHLSVQIGERWRVGLYETVVYSDSAGTRGFEFDYLVPIIFYRPVEFALGSNAGNVILGANLHYKLTDRIRLYGQVALDEFKFSEITAGNGWWANKYTVQVGVKLLETFPGLFLQSEFNYARPYTYTHRQGDMAYTHYNQALAHTLGANFRELILIANYYRGRWFGEALFQFSWRGLDPPGENWGSQVLLGYETREQEYGNETLQGVRTNIFYSDLRAGWVVNPSYNLRFEVGLRWRDFAPDTNILQATNTTYWFVGLRTALNNIYEDF